MDDRIELRGEFDGFTGIGELDQFVDFGDDGEVGQVDIDLHVLDAHPADPQSAVIARIREIQVFRRNCIQARIRINNQVLALASRGCGYSNDLPEKDRKRIQIEAKSLIAYIEAKYISEYVREKESKQEEKNRQKAAKAMASNARGRKIFDAMHGTDMLECLTGYVLNAMEACKPWDKLQKKYDKDMEAAVTKLRVWPWAEKIKGLGAVSLGTIIGETGDLSLYRTHSRVWKRMGMAVIEGERQRKYADVDKAKKHSYVPRRRSVVWVAGDSLLRQKNEYRNVYEARRFYEAEKAGPDHATIKYYGKKLNKDGEEYDSFSRHCSYSAKRYAEKRLLKHLWQAWRRGHLAPDLQAATAPPPSTDAAAG